eukprot:TRINITY_DN4454_c0_g2_i2.p5 TRINITY_DN4454_c0_g2~~TRINITY_DN4454_c0_g2_i2.p5  ORF type:complete len:121 (-),score=2.97 TRINITY_DN4454_c0_g2_i2:827-1189(-)
MGQLLKQGKQENRKIEPQKGVERDTFKCFFFFKFNLQFWVVLLQKNSTYRLRGFFGYFKQFYLNLQKFFKKKGFEKLICIFCYQFEGEIQIQILIESFQQRRFREFVNSNKLTIFLFQHF